MRLIERIGSAKDRIPYWFQIEVGQTVGRRMQSLRSSVPAELLQIYENNEFWHDPRAKKPQCQAQQASPQKYREPGALCASRGKCADRVGRLGRSQAPAGPFTARIPFSCASCCSQVRPIWRWRNDDAPVSCQWGNRAPGCRELWCGCSRCGDREIRTD